MKKILNNLMFWMRKSSAIDFKMDQTIGRIAKSFIKKQHLRNNYEQV